MTTALTPVEIMVTWKESEDQNVQVEYSVNDQEFSDYQLYGRHHIKHRIDPLEECFNNDNPFYREYCEDIFPKGT